MHLKKKTKEESGEGEGEGASGGLKVGEIPSGYHRRIKFTVSLRD